MTVRELIAALTELGEDLKDCRVLIGSADMTGLAEIAHVGQSPAYDADGASDREVWIECAS